MELKAKFSKWGAGMPVSILNRDTATTLGINIEETIVISTISRHSKKISSTVHIVDGNLVRKNEIYVSSEIRKKLHLRKGERIDVSIAPESKSLVFIKKKLNNKKLSSEEIDQVIKDIVNNNISDPETALFVAGMSVNGMDMKETIALTSSILKYGNKLNLRSDLVVDKHSTGGVAGNRTTPIIVSICAAAGLIFPKTSSRAITSEAGTADTIEAVADVEFTLDELKKILKKTGAFIVWGGSFGIAPADAEIIKIEKTLKIDPKSQMLASIMAKKLAVGSNHILIDIPYGKNAKVSKKKAELLKKDFMEIGKYFHKNVTVVLTDGSQPIGNGIGPSLELIDIIKILDPKQKGPEDLKKKSILLSGKILEMTKKAKKGEGTKKAYEILMSGKAFIKFKQIIAAQGGNLDRIKPSKFKKEIHSKYSGKIKSIDGKKIISLARILGCPGDKASGIYIHNHVNDKIKKNDVILTLYSETKYNLNAGIRFCREEKIVEINH
ncbi:thymidine phosphorylase [Candidatus Pacearchaeota archaeon]|nr:thymidine phosphorylase [Candidatus Pacearchaeota archaeon]